MSTFNKRNLDLTDLPIDRVIDIFIDSLSDPDLTYLQMQNFTPSRWTMYKMAEDLSLTHIVELPNNLLAYIGSLYPSQVASDHLYAKEFLKRVRNRIEIIMTNYEERLKLGISGDGHNLFTESGLQMSNGYNRIVIGGRGPYVEFTKEQIIESAFMMPENQKWRITNQNAYYLEYRSTDKSRVKIYFQIKQVDYADYVIGMFYISPFALCLEDGTKVITPIRGRT